MATVKTIKFPELRTFTRDEIELLADTIFSLGVSSISSITTDDQADLILASRVLRRLLSTFERSTGRELRCLMLEMP